MLGWRKLMGSAAGAVDRAFATAIQVRSARDRARADAMSHDERMTVLDAIARAYAGPDGSPVPAVEDFFPTPPAIDPALRSVRAGVFDAAWPSTCVPYLEQVATAYLARVENRTARARLFLGSSSRPAIVAVHGYMGGYYAFEEAQWPIRWLARRGIDVALPVLPFHATRAGARRGAPTFPSADPRMTNEGFRQAVADVVALVRFLRARGAPKVGVVGVSLGGYTAALLATVSSDIDFVMPMIPLGSIADFAREQGRLGRGADADAEHDALERANAVVSPLARPPKLAPSRALVVAADNDGITPRSHAERIARHFGCELVTMTGGHLVQLDRAAGFRALARMLEREGIIAARARRP